MRLYELLGPIRVRSRTVGMGLQAQSVGAGQGGGTLPPAGVGWGGGGGAEPPAPRRRQPPADTAPPPAPPPAPPAATDQRITGETAVKPPAPPALVEEEGGGGGGGETYQPSPPALREPRSTPPTSGDKPGTLPSGGAGSSLWDYLNPPGRPFYARPITWLGVAAVAAVGAAVVMGKEKAK